MCPDRLTARDLAELAAAGIAPEEAERQLAQLASPPPPVRLARPATVGDGIHRLAPADHERLLAAARAAAAEGRFAKFVPASGAASRMFRSLAAFLERGDEARAGDLAARAALGDEVAREVVAFVDALPRLALTLDLAPLLGRSPDELAALARREPLRRLVAAVLEADGLGALALPKALVPFHAVALPGGGEATRTAFAEQLVEGAAWLADRSRRVRIHFTVPPGTTALFAARLEAARAPLEADLGVRFAVGFSEQDPATDTLALDGAGRPFRRADGALLRRPAGHGALLGDLERMGGDIVFVKNIDNVLPAARHAEIARCKLLLAGRLLELERAVHGWQRELAAGELGDDEVERALDFFARRFGSAAAAAAIGAGEPRDARRALLADLVDRPLRVAGVVPASGEPGGGPFWVLDESGRESLQIVESSQIDATSPAQVAQFRAATHFNPVDLVLSLADAWGRPYPLGRFVDPGAAFVARRSEGGRELVALERPGLWNGAMAGWSTHFVEVPGSTFAPVKTVLDLARPEHARALPPAHAPR
jgi:hypothetical protein